MTVEAIQNAIEELSEEERDRIAHWLEELQEHAWDRQMEGDLSPHGRGGHLLEKIDHQIEAGQFGSLEDGLRSSRRL